MIDLDIARQNIPGGESGLQHMAKLMKSESSRLMNELRTSQSNLDAVAFQRAAHTLKSAAAIFGAETIVNVARDLEATGKSGDISNTKEQIDELGGLVDDLNAELDALLG